MPYRPSTTSAPGRAIMLFRTLPEGSRLTARELGVALRVRHTDLKRRLAAAVDAQYLAVETVDLDDIYCLGHEAPVADHLERRTRGPARGQRTSRGVQRDPEARRAHGGSLRELMDTGAAIETGNPLRELADLHDAGRRVLAAKAVSRFKGAEVDVAVAREMRCITQAIAQATANLNRYLEVML